jgi:hypothetical protein
MSGSVQQCSLRRAPPASRWPNSLPERRGTTERTLLFDEGGVFNVWRVKDLADSGLDSEAPDVALADEQALRSELARLATLEPRVVGVALSDKEYLHVGLGGMWAFVEHVVDEPWKAEVALSDLADVGQRPESVWFVCGRQGSEIPGQYLMATAEAIEVVVECLRLDRLPSAWRWELG